MSSHEQTHIQIMKIKINLRLSYMESNNDKIMNESSFKGEKKIQILNEQKFVWSVNLPMWFVDYECWVNEYLTSLTTKHSKG